MAEIFPKAKFIFLIRNPLAVLNSILNTWIKGNYSKLPEFTSDIFLAPYLMLDGINKLGSKAIIIRYEDFVTNYEDNLKYICLKLNIPYEEGIIHYNNYNILRGRYGDQVGVHKYNKPVQNSLDSWMDLANDPQKKEIANKLLSDIPIQIFNGLGYDKKAIECELNKKSNYNISGQKEGKEASEIAVKTRTVNLQKNTSHSNALYQQKSFGNSSVKNAISNAYPRITIVIPSFNQGKYLERTVKSILEQNYPDLEFIIIDGGSSDNSVDVIKKYEDVFSYWVSEKDNGQADAINKGLARATGAIFNWINADDYLEPGALLRVAETYKNNPEAAGWIGACRRIDELENILNVIYPNNLTLSNIGENWNGRQFYQPACFLNTKMVKELNGVDEKLNAPFDLDLWIRILKLAEFQKGIGIWANALIHSRAKTQKAREDMFRETIKIQKKYGFYKGAQNRHERSFMGGEFKFIIPGELKNKIDNIEKYNLIKDFVNVKNKKIIVVSNFVPRYDQASSNLRFYEILNILLINNFEITYLYFFDSGNDEKYIRNLKGNILFQRLLPNVEIIVRYVKNSGFDKIWFTNLWNLSFVQLINDTINRIKLSLPNFKVIVDTMDFHYKKYALKYQVSGSHEDLDTANKFLDYEKSLYSSANEIVVVNDREKEDISTNIPDIKKITVIPNIHRIGNKNIYWKSENKICFLGNFDVNHNIDAAYHFIKNIFPKILEKMPEAEFHILGHNSLRLKEKFISQNVKVIGEVESVENTLMQYKLFVCSMTYGAGMKGKIGSAASIGLPVVTTSIGAEGFDFIDGEHLFIADEPTEFASKCLHVLNDAVCWNNFSLKSKLKIAQNYSLFTVSEKLNALFAQCEKTRDYPSIDYHLHELKEKLHEKGWDSKYDLYKPDFNSVEYKRIVDSPNISVIVISWRLHPDTIKNFHVLEGQRDKNFELIFVNNGADEKEFSQIENYVDTYVKLNKNTGAYLARNIGAVFGKASILLFLEDDGIPCDNIIEAHLNAHAKYDIIALRGVYLPKTSNPLNKIAAHYYLGDKPRSIFADLEGNSSYNAEIFFKAGGWDDNIYFGGGGVDLSIRLLKLDNDKRKQIYSPAPVLYHDYAKDK
ncbi:MAG: glycosyltransferase, partial [Candidatus Thorarchaeota archaeon]